MAFSRHKISMDIQSYALDRLLSSGLWSPRHDHVLQVVHCTVWSISAALCCLTTGVLRIPADRVVVEMCIAKKTIPSLDWYGLLRQMPASEWDHGTETCTSPTWVLSLTAFPWAICAAKQAWRSWKNREGRSSCFDSFEMENNVADWQDGRL